MTNERAVLVTCGARGIGRAIAEHLAESGWKVVATYKTGFEESVELRRTHGVEIRQLDMTDRSRSLDFARQIRSEFSFDALVNNAGILEKEAFSASTLGAWDRAFEVNVTAPLIPSQALGPHMSSSSRPTNMECRGRTRDHGGRLGRFPITGPPSSRPLGWVTREPHGVRRNLAAPSILMSQKPPSK
jgi:NAD(P)-dependent dehydrogenase (short-subunit alcohol dehydrogenase family)